MATIEKILRERSRVLNESGSETGRLDAEVLLAHCLGLDRVDLFRLPDRELTQMEEQCFDACVERRRKGEPVAYIRGYKEFWSIRLKITPDVLIPRPDTEILVEEAVNFCKDRSGCRILEIGTGSGAISVALAASLKNAKITATDISPQAIRVAAENAASNGATGRIDFREGDLFEPVTGVFDAIVSNPPYIPEQEYNQLPRGVRDFEPVGALLAGPGGTEFHRRIISGARKFLAPDGCIFLEIGSGQEEQVARLFKDFGFIDLGFAKDYAGNIRVAKGKRNLKFG